MLVTLPQHTPTAPLIRANVGPPRHSCIHFLQSYLVWISGYLKLPDSARSLDHVRRQILPLSFHQPPKRPLFMANQSIHQTCKLIAFASPILPISTHRVREGSDEGKDFQYFIPFSFTACAFPLSVLFGRVKFVPDLHFFPHSTVHSHFPIPFFGARMPPRRAIFILRTKIYLCCSHCFDW